MNLLQGDCLARLKELPDSSVDSLVTDPPAGIGFMGKDWDHHKGGREAWVSWMTEVMRECLRVLKPGAHALVWAIPRTSHWTATALEDAGFEVRDCVTHLFGSGFPKSMDISKAIDKAAGATREVVGRKTGRAATPIRDIRGGGLIDGRANDLDCSAITAPATDDAKEWQGWGTALKPAVEFWWLCRKPLSEKTVAANVLKHGTGGINVDGCRIPGAIPQVPQPKLPGGDILARETAHDGRNGELSRAEGRFPANLVLSHSEGCTDVCEPECAVRMLDEQSGVLVSKWGKQKRHGGGSMFGIGGEIGNANDFRGDSGGASRFFYCAKASKSDRNRKVK